MATVPKRVADRIIAGLKHYQPILTEAKSRDIGEADTVTIVKDMLAGIFGYDKYTDLTSEYAIRGTYCDLALKLDGQLQTLIEVKAIGIELRDAHVRQAVNYAANQGVDWVLLTNGIQWRVYHVLFTKPIKEVIVVDIDICCASPRSASSVELLYLWCKEGWRQSVLKEYNSEKQALSRYLVASVLVTEPVLSVVRRELRRVSPEVRISTDQVEAVLVAEVLRREVTEGDEATAAKRKVTRAVAKHEPPQMDKAPAAADSQVIMTPA
jgi:predicted type IV restriction endonuclease